MSNLNADKLRELKKLLDEGIITQDEFDKKKKEFLEEISESDTLSKDNSNKEAIGSDALSKDDSSELTDPDDNNSMDKNDKAFEITDSNDSDKSTLTGDDSDEDDNSNKSSGNGNYKIGAVIVAIVAIVAIFGIYINHKSKEAQTPVNTAQTENKGPTSDEWKEFDNKSWADFKELNEKLDSLKKTVEDTSNPNRTDELENAEHYFSDKEDTLNYDSNDEQEKYLEPMKKICEKAEDICENALKDNSSNNESALTEIKNKLNDLENDVNSVIDGRHSILNKAGYTEQEIKDIFDKIKQELHIN